jgi:hypothetical protein
MTNDEQVAILNIGVDAWNAWLENLDVRPDFRGANLSGADLSEVNLSEADSVGVFTFPEVGVVDPLSQRWPLAEG